MAMFPTCKHVGGIGGAAYLALSRKVGYIYMVSNLDREFTKGIYADAEFYHILRTNVCSLPPRPATGGRK